MRKLIFILSLFSILVLRAEDSIPDVNLEGVEVKAERVWFENGKAISIPTKNEKNLSNSPEELVRSMNLPMLRYEDGLITGPTGTPVTYFINGVKADRIEIENFWPKQVRRVEYIENPTDASFEGCTSVVNFIMPVYVIGGQTNIDLYQKVPVFGSYGVSSMLTYKKMTYGMMFNGEYSRDHRPTRQGDEIYRDFYYEGRHYDQITRKLNENSWERENMINAAFNARYRTDRFRATHTVGLVWSQNPGSGFSSSDVWSTDLFGSSSWVASTRSRNLSPQVSGEYLGKINERWSISGNWRFLYARNSLTEENRLGNNPLVVNDVHENVKTLTMSVTPYFKLSDKVYFQGLFNTEVDWFHTLYGGTSSARSKQKRGFVQASVRMGFIPNPKMQILVQPGVYSSFWKSGNDDSGGEIRPVISSSLNFMPSRRISLGQTVRFTTSSPAAGQSTDVIIRQSDLIWIQGNTNLKNQTYFSTYTFATWIPVSFFSVSPRFGYDYIANELFWEYYPATKEMSGLIKKSENSGSANEYYFNIGLNGRLLDGNLNINITPSYRYRTYNNSEASSLGKVSCSGRIDYTLHGVRMSAWYDGPTSILTAGGKKEVRNAGYFNFQLTYGTGDWYFSMRVEDVLNKMRKKWTTYSSDLYSSFERQLLTGRKVSFNVSYTFGYGKRTDDGIDVASPNPGKTGILGY